MNTAAEEILAFKTCCGMRAWDQNLEILVRNTGPRPMVVRGYFDMEGDEGRERVRTVMPPGDRKVGPGEIVAFYCTMDEERWKKARRVVFFDARGNEYAAPVSPA